MGRIFTGPRIAGWNGSCYNDRMRKAIVVALLFLLCGSLSDRADSHQRGTLRAAAPHQGLENYMEPEDDLFPFSYEQDILSRKIFQKTLPPLDNREKIVWSFKIADRDPFL